MAFRCVGSPLDEMKRLEKLLERDPESAANLVANGKLLVDFVRMGICVHCNVQRSILRRVKCDLLCRSDVSRGLRDEKTGYLRFMLLNSFDLQQSYMRDILHNIIENVDNPQSADAVQPLIRFLLDAGVDINWQRKSDLYTALHIACCQNLYPIAYLLVIYGADVNAIAADDSMPLACANSIGQTTTLTEDDQTQKELLVSFLLENQARPTWRKQQRRAPTTSATGSSQPKQRILSFSSSFGIHCSIDDSTDNQGQAGIMFDTSDPTESL
ncbi:Ankyrin repeat-containing domain [Phytophthora cactorum]|nr:Ankyrin repeat-containing domain [Phytophthora cactorum]